MRRFTGMAARAGIRPGTPAAKASPSAWATGRDSLAGHFATAAAVHVPRAAATTVRADLFRAYTAEGMGARLSVSVRRIVLLPARADWWRPYLVASMAARSDTFARRTWFAVTASWAMDRERTASGMPGRADVFAVARGRMSAYADVLLGRVAGGMPSRNRVSAPAVGRLLSNADLLRLRNANALPVRALISAGAVARMTAGAAWLCARVAGEQVVRFAGSAPTSERLVIRLETLTGRATAELAARAVLGVSARAVLMDRADVLAAGLAAVLLSRHGLGAARMAGTAIRAEYLRAIVGSELAERWGLSASGMGRLGMLSDWQPGRATANLAVRAGWSARAGSGFPVRADALRDVLAAALAGRSGLWVSARMALSARADFCGHGVASGAPARYGCFASTDARGIGRSDYWRPAWAARLAGRADLGALVAAQQAAASGIDRDERGSVAPALLAVHTPSSAKSTAWFEIHPTRYGEPLPAGWALNVMASNRMPAAFGVECARTAEILAAFFQARQLHMAALGNRPEAIWPNLFGNAVPAQWEWHPVHSALLASTVDLMQDGRHAAGLARWVQRTVAGEARPSIIDIIVPRQSVPGQAAAWEVRQPVFLAGGAAWDSWTALSADSLAVHAAIRPPANEQFPAVFDGYGRETKIHWGPPFRFDLRLPLAWEQATAWDLFRTNFAVPAVSAQWAIRVPRLEILLSRGNTPAPRHGLSASQWDRRAGVVERLADVHEVALREYVRDLVAFASAWTSSRTPNAAYQYGPGGVYGYWAKPWIAQAARHDIMRFGYGDRIPARLEIRRETPQGLKGAVWDFAGIALSATTAARWDYSGATPSVYLVAEWGWRPFGAVADRLASGHHALCPAGIRLVARDTATGTETDLGFIPEDDLDGGGHGVLAGVAIPDGEYAIEARPSSFFWPDARAGTAPIYRLEAGVPPQVQLPAVVDLVASLSPDFWRMLEWSVEGDAGEADYALGVWFGDTEPVDLSGAPDAVIPRAKGLEHYGHFFQQTEPRHVAVAAFNAEARGRPATLFLPWDAADSESPAYQWAVENMEGQ